MRTIAEADDFKLLRRFVEADSQEAFSQLVDRHIDLVYSVCLRETSDPVLAQDVTQAVFLLLFRKAPTIRRGTVLAGWLFNTARFASKNAMRQELRRRAREQELSEDVAQSDDHGGAWRAVEPLLHEGIASLGAKDRDAILLRFFEDKSLREVGAQLGMTEKAAQMRVARAVERLKKYLHKRGVSVPPAILGTVLLENAVQAAPASCVHAVGTVLGNTATATAHTISQEVVRSMFTAKLKAALVTATLCAAGIAGAACVSKQNSPGAAGDLLVGRWQSVPEGDQSMQFFENGKCTAITVLKNKVVSDSGTYRIVDGTHALITSDKNNNDEKLADSVEFHISGDRLTMNFYGMTRNFKRINTSDKSAS